MLAALLTVLLAAGPGPIEAEVARLRGVAASEGLAAYDARLACVAAEARGGRTWLALHSLQNAFAELEARTYTASRPKAASTDRAAFEADWSALGKEIAARNARLDAPPPRRQPAAIVALVQSARGVSGPFYQSARLYGLNSTLTDGLLYSGYSRAWVDFALLCGGLETGPAKAALAIPPLERAIAELDAETVAAFSRATAEERARFPRVNSTLKLASELEARGRREGALYKYLEAHLLLGLLVDAPGAAPAASDLDALAGRLGGETDHTIGELFLQMARSALEGACEADQDRERRAAVVVSRVLPRYVELVGKERP